MTENNNGQFQQLNFNFKKGSYDLSPHNPIFEAQVEYRDSFGTKLEFHQDYCLLSLHNTSNRLRSISGIQKGEILLFSNPDSGDSSATVSVFRGCIFEFDFTPWQLKFPVQIKMYPNRKELFRFQLRIHSYLNQFSEKVVPLLQHIQKKYPFIRNLDAFAFWVRPKHEKKLSQAVDRHLRNLRRRRQPYTDDYVQALRSEANRNVLKMCLRDFKASEPS